jgi:hypothetical protein
VLWDEARASMSQTGGAYFVSLCAVCLRQVLQNLENSRRPVGTAV